MSTKPALPTTDQLKKIMEIATRPETAQYFLNGFEDVLKKAKAYDKDFVQPILNSVKDFANYIITQAARDIWAGKMPETSPYINFLDGLASKAAKEVGAQDVVFNYAASDKSEILRAYTDKNTGEGLSTESTAAMDKGLSAVLAQHEMMIHDGRVYEMTSNGEMKKDKDQNPILVDPADLIKVIEEKLPKDIRSIMPVNVEVSQQPFKDQNEQQVSPH